MSSFRSFLRYTTGIRISAQRKTVLCVSKVDKYRLLYFIGKWDRRCINSSEVSFSTSLYDLSSILRDFNCCNLERVQIWREKAVIS